jgi:hypothetical protein
VKEIETAIEFAHWSANGEGKDLASGEVICRTQSIVRLSLRCISTACPWLVWCAPIFLIVTLPVVGLATRLVLGSACGAIEGLLLWSEQGKDSNLPLLLYLPAAGGLIVGLVIAAARL